QHAADAQQQRREERRPHDDVVDRQSPAAGFSMDATDMIDEADSPIEKQRGGGGWQQSARDVTVECAPDARDSHRTTEEDGAIHDALTVTANDMLVTDFEAAKQ